MLHPRSFLFWLAEGGVIAVLGFYVGVASMRPSPGLCETSDRVHENEQRAAKSIYEDAIVRSVSATPATCSVSEQDIQRIAALVTANHAEHAAPPDLLAQEMKDDAESAVQQRMSEQMARDELVARLQGTPFLQTATIRDLMTDPAMNKLPPQEQARILNEIVMPAINELGDEERARFFVKPSSPDLQ